ncbi:MBL fold metallo-hydrolase [Sphingomonas sp. ABOLH]|uniref:ComEC/Rec2 family competence protein n=1 Tax=Sphingomonas sp. ABOLH TaxID=1985881 RepID=UPI000F7F54AC|nr:MBL fold metallo-hydrolase [Sphingomonas sp. ABOLH]RSV32175.1 hypothetical protein CA237_03660 [Sphingomonas sp. ABOLH]
MTVYRLEAFPAREGDCLLLSYGPSEDSLAHVLVDAGHTSTGKALAVELLERGIVELELLVVTHVDADHIEGMLDFLEAVSGRIAIADVWFNGWRHLQEGLEGMGPAQGERLTTLIAQLPWNAIAGGRAIRVEDDRAPRRLPPLPGGLSMTVLSPDRRKLERMIPEWKKACLKAGLIPGQGRSDDKPRHGLEALGMDLEALAATRTKNDTAVANGTSIALLAEYGGRRVLLGADAHPDVLTRSLQAAGGGHPLPLDLFKVPHHGSQANVTRELLASIDCREFLISTDGTKFDHPDEVAVARMIASRSDGVRLLFNYRQPRTKVWEPRIGTDARHPFECVFPDAAGNSLVVDLLPDVRISSGRPRH